ncbi:type II secretion system F family protein [Streptomyces sp. TRM 70351]|uniref:type II secretion system F family protein n=1 Tax=Streptomyces sp. TRM 70351 TaxID=3116552 RepID=UPI002E7AEB33|nr:type II secretion system F family protein [Streptomyces sp. TRM 70351]MEE1930274.1 type II secretion system F family protein [Streptomyces sp. TRM 70351]
MTGAGAWTGGGSGTLCAALLCAGAAAWLTGGPGTGARRARLLASATAPTGSGRGGGVGGSGPGPTGGAAPAAGAADGRTAGRAGHSGPFRRAVLRLLARVRERTNGAWLCLPAAGAVAVAGGSVLPLLAGALATPLAVRWLGARERRRAAEAGSAAVIGLCSAVAAELRAGRQPGQALLAAGADGLGEAGAGARAAARFGGDVPAALRHAARSPGAAGLGGVAACWQVAVDGGAGLADGLDRIADALRAARDQREELRAQLAGPRTTALALALLPVFGLLLGTAMGAAPLRFLLHSPAGWAVSAGAALLEWAGLAWTARIVRAAEGGVDGAAGER